LQTHYRHATQNAFKIGAKLVRGAYMEKERARAKTKGYPDPIQETKAKTDADYNAALHFCLNHINNMGFCAGTHNEESSLLLAKAIQQKGLQSNHPHIWFSQLYGMSDHISFNLAHLKYNVAKYLPYGPVVDVLPYLIRRAQENTSVKGQTGRELKLIIKELNRRNSI
jgi:proline dehydrogenase